MRFVIGVSLGALLSACIAVTVTPVEPVKEGPIPKPFAGKEPPQLIPTEIEGLFRAPSLAPNVYFHEPEEDWYRYAYRRWYKAFRWNGNWFILEARPTVLASLELEGPEDLPAFDDLEKGELDMDTVPRDKYGLPTLPDLEDPPDLDDAEDYRDEGGELDMRKVPRDKHGLPTLPELEDAPDLPDPESDE